MRKVLTTGLRFALLALCLQACSGSNQPLDAATRQAVDSLSTAQIRQARADLDSLCLQQRTTVLPQMVDSIKKHRLREIEEQLKTVPK